MHRDKNERPSPSAKHDGYIKRWNGTVKRIMRKNATPRKTK